jgi:hypothetical protein
MRTLWERLKDFVFGKRELRVEYDDVVVLDRLFYRLHAEGYWMEDDELRLAASWRRALEDERRRRGISA